MKTIARILILILFCTKGIAQNHIEPIDLKNSIFKDRVEISGITKKGDVLYLASERTKKILQVDVNTRKLMKIFTFEEEDALQKCSDGKRKIEIEGITLYKKDYLLMIDEHHGAIYSYNLKSNEFNNIYSHKKITEVDVNGTSYGIEGIAVNEDKKLLYLLREKNKKNRGEIYTYSIETTKKDHEIIKIKYKSRKNLESPSQKINWRYTDICFDKKNNQLLCLKSYYKGICSNENKYQIDVVLLDTNGYTKTWNTENLAPKLTKENQEYRKKHNTNLEGIVIGNNEIYLVSDNRKDSNEKCNKKTDNKTALIKITLDKKE